MALKGYIGFKGEQGLSAYDIAVKKGFTGTENDWLATLGTSNKFDKDVLFYTSEEGQSEFDIPEKYNSNSQIDVYVEGRFFTNDKYELDENNKKIILNLPLNEGTEVEINMITMTTNSLPIVETISADSTNDTTAGTLAIYNEINKVYKICKTELVDIICRNVGPLEEGNVFYKFEGEYNKDNCALITKLISIDGGNNYYENKIKDCIEINSVSYSERGITIILKNVNSAEIFDVNVRLIIRKVGS